MTALALAHALHLGLVVAGAVVLGWLLLPVTASGGRSTAPSWRRARRDVDAHLARLERQALAELTGTRPATGTPVGVAVVATLGSALVHAAAFPAHLRESVLLGTFFCGCALAQLGWVVLAVRRPRAGARLLGTAGSLGLVALWLWSRRVGVPLVAPGSPEPVGAWDTTATALELLAAAACLRPWAPAVTRAAFGRPARVLAVTTGAVLCGLALTGAPS